MEENEHCRWRSPRGIWLPLLMIIGSVIVAIVAFAQLRENFTVSSLVKILSFFGIAIGVTIVFMKKGKASGKIFLLLVISSVVALLASIFTSPDYKTGEIYKDMIFDLIVAVTIITGWTKLCPGKKPNNE